jgi:hypothetical protein
MGSNPIALTIKIKKTYCFGDHGGQYRRRLRAGLQILKKFCENRTFGPMFRLTGRDLGSVPLVRVAPLAESIQQ